MKCYHKILRKLNDLQIMNNEIEKVYLKALKEISNNKLRAFFQKKGFEKSQFVRLLQGEINKLKMQNNSIELDRRFSPVSTNYSKLLHIDNDGDLYESAYKIEQFSVEKYNELLMELNLPLSLCKLLIKQRDRIEFESDLIKEETMLVY